MQTGQDEFSQRAANSPEAIHASLDRWSGHYTPPSGAYHERQAGRPDPAD